MAALGDRSRLVAPDLPGRGPSETPEDHPHTFDGRADLLGRLATAAGAECFVLDLHGFGSQIGSRLAVAEPRRIAGLIIQDGDIPEDTLGPKHEAPKGYWANPTPEVYARIAAGITIKEVRREFLNDVRPELADLIPPDLWRPHGSHVTDRRKPIAADIIAGLKDTSRGSPAVRLACGSIDLRRRSSGDRKTAACRRPRHAPTCATCPTQSCTCSMAGAGHLRHVRTQRWR